MSENETDGALSFVKSSIASLYSVATWLGVYSTMPQALDVEAVTAINEGLIALRRRLEEVSVDLHLSAAAREKMRQEEASRSAEAERNSQARRRAVARAYSSVSRAMKKRKPRAEAAR